MNRNDPNSQKSTIHDDDTINPAYQSEADAPAEGARHHEEYHDTDPTGESTQQHAEMDAGDDPAEGGRSTDEELEVVRDVPQGATEAMTVREDEAGALPDEKVNAMELPDSAMPSEIAPQAGNNEDKAGEVPMQDNTGGRWNVDTIAPVPPETKDLQEAFNPTSNPNEPQGEVF